jgi:hypothetical protein
MRVKTLCLLALLILAALPALSAVPAAAAPPTSPVTLADILAPASAQPAAAPDLTLVSSHRPLLKLGCRPICTTTEQCRTLCNCVVAVCETFTGCANKSCNCSACP